LLLQCYSKLKTKIKAKRDKQARERERDGTEDGAEDVALWSEWQRSIVLFLRRDEPSALFVRFHKEFYRPTSDVMWMLLFDFTFPSWPHSWQQDDVRSPVWTVQIHAGQTDDHQQQTTTTYGLYLPSAIFWLEIVTCVLLLGCFAALVATCVYYTIVRQPRGSNLAWMTGFGIYIPLWIALPYYTVDYLQFDNQLFRFTLLVVIPIVCAFRTSEAIYGFAPPRATASLRKYMFYYASPLYVTLCEILYLLQ
jgi:hypothetical protein